MIFRCALGVIGLTSVLWGAPPNAAPSVQASGIERKFQAIQNSPPELYAFLYRMPKGGDLHNHLAGAAYAENMLQAAAKNGLCVEDRTQVLALANGGAQCGPGQTAVERLETDNPRSTGLVDAFSMRDFVPGKESAHDHFFASFEKFSAIVAQDPGRFVAEVVGRAAQQNESYLELMALVGLGPISDLGKQVGFDGNLEQTAAKLRAGGLPQMVDGLRKEVDRMEQQRRQRLGCAEKPDSAACQVTVRYIYQVLREFSKEQVFAQTLAGFLLADSDPRVVAVNFVQPEDGLTSMRDYHLHMQMVDYMKHQFPRVHVTLHAGELASGLTPPEGLRFHMREAIELGHAERIGHGVSVMYEDDALGLLDLMRKRKIAVEINLTSNDVILGVRGSNHPLPTYLKYGVPAALSTDDEGVSRTHMTQEYQRAVLTYHFSYAQLKTLVRNSLEFSFLPGESYWADASYRQRNKACTATNGETCRSFLAGSEKARIQADLEKRFERFEQSY